MYTKFFKRIADFIVALTALLLFSPILLVLIILLAFANNGKPFFLQKRPGKNAKIFSLVKFKTMNDKKDQYGNLLPDNLRITKVGRFLRNSSLDELLQLINVIKGDMSLVGPRPLLVEYLPRYNEEQAKRHLVKPGITGWAQVNGRNAITWDERFALDVCYVENIGFVTDMKILILTVKKVLQQEGTTTKENDTMPKFMGNA